MREWNLKLGDPLSLTLAADPRLGETDYFNDHIWELSLEGGEPPALALQTTYGLRARGMRIFPRFTEGNLTENDPASFHRPVTVHHFYPNFIQVSFSPFPDIDVLAEYWVPASQVVAGRLKIINLGTAVRKLQLEWVALLTPTPDGERMASSKIEAVSVLIGRTGDLAPVFFMTGGAQVGPGPYPSLTTEVDLSPQDSRSFTWVQAALPDQNASFDLARQTAARNWDAESARIEMSNAGQLEIHTGDPDWDAAFALTQKTALGLFLGPTQHLASPSFVFTRQPDQGFSLRGDGSDYNHLWNGQTALEAYCLSGLLLPYAPDLVEGLLTNFLLTQTDDGLIDWKPGLGGQRSQVLATPILTNLTWRLYQATQDQAFLEKAFPKLLAFLQSWFAPEHDRDSDGIPEWDHPMQTGFDDHPLFAHWQPWSQGVNITTIESPDLCAYLYRECTLLVKIAHLVGRSDAIPALQAMADNLKAAVEASWVHAQTCYHYWDRDSHYSPPMVVLGRRHGSGEMTIHRQFKQPLRLLLYIHTAGEAKRNVQIFLHGTGISGDHRVERIPGESFRWYLDMGKATSERVYTSIEHLEIQGLEEDDQITLQSVGYTFHDHSVLLPLWACIPDHDRARELIQQTITSARRFWRPYGIRACEKPPATAEDAPSCHSVHILWNTLLGEGLLAYDQRAKASTLVSRMMKAIVQTLKGDGAFRQLYHAETGAGLGERNALHGLAPVSLFMDTLGVRVISSRQVAISGPNPFPWPVTVKFRGLTVLHQKKKTMVIFPNGQDITLNNRKAIVVTQE